MADICEGPRASSLSAVLTIKQAYAELQVSRTHFRSLCASGAIRTIRIGPRGLRVPREEISRFIRERLEG